MMKTPSRLLNHIQGNQNSLANNQKFQFAKQHSLSLYRHNAIYTLIPKNACTTLRASISIANGIFSPEDLDQERISWIHSNTYTFGASLSELATSDYTFVILRCPYDKLVSLFFDKFVDKTKVSIDFYEKSNHKIDPDKITFNQFISFMHSNPSILECNIHWKRQSDFLVYQQYDDYFDFSDFKHIKSTLINKIGLNIIDTRLYTNHGRDNITPIDNNKDYSDASVQELKTLKDKNILPNKNQMITNINRPMIKEIYKEDINLYSRFKHN